MQAGFSTGRGLGGATTRAAEVLQETKDPLPNTAKHLLCDLCMSMC